MTGVLIFLRGGFAEHFQQDRRHHCFCGPGVGNMKHLLGQQKQLDALNIVADQMVLDCSSHLIVLELTVAFHMLQSRQIMKILLPTVSLRHQ